MSTYRAFQVTGQRQFDLVHRELLGPQPGHVRFRVQSCGVGDDPIEVNASDLVFGIRSIVGSLTGSAIENEACLQFSATHRVAPMTEVLPFEDAPAAYERMMSGQARFRVVLDMQTQ